MKMKKLASLLLVLAMVLAMTVTAFATVPQGSLTVQNTVKDADYTIYRLFDLESYAGSNENDAHSYKVASKWAAYFAADAGGRNYFDVDENGYVSAKESINAAEFAQKALAYAKANNIVADGTMKGTGGAIKFAGLDLGYYLVDSSVGALCALTTTDPDGVVIEKNSEPSLDKEVKENPDGTWGSVNDANIGDTVEFKATITVQGYAKNYVMHDKMDDGLTYVSVTSVTLNGNEVTADGNYTVNVNPTDGCTFEVAFSDAFCAGLKSGDVIVVYYSATLNDNAVVKEAENNKAHLSYTDVNGESHDTQEKETKTFTWEIPVLKYSNDDMDTPLAGAKFSLFKNEACTEIIKFTSKGNNIYRVDPNGAVTEITTDATGKFELEGLDAGTYYLKETEAPAGYNKLNTIVKVVIEHDGKITVDGATAEVTEVAVNNKSGTELPSTGGTGTTIFYVLGSILVVAAGVLLVTKKRMSNRA